MSVDRLTRTYYVAPAVCGGGENREDKEHKDGKDDKEDKKNTEDKEDKVGFNRSYRLSSL